ncbi:unnamed protein product [Urochloa humidicola]
MKMLETRRLRKRNWKRKRQVRLLNKAWTETTAMPKFHLCGLLQGGTCHTICRTAEPASNIFVYEKCGVRMHYLMPSVKWLPLSNAKILELFLLIPSRDLWTSDDWPNVRTPRLL